MSFDVGGESFALISWPLPRRAPEGAGRLTDSELAVVELAVEGLSNAAIARARGTSAGTVANQLASAYRKLGVGARSGLAAWASGHPTSTAKKRG